MSGSAAGTTWPGVSSTRQYRSHTVSTNTDSNEVKTEWKLIRILLLASVLTLTSGCATMHRQGWHRQVVPSCGRRLTPTLTGGGGPTPPPPTVIEPQVVRRIKVQVSAKDTEIGASYGVSIELRLLGMGSPPITTLRKIS
jgi:hypothetical protein